jgi:rhodanese-related sulfurtransferase
MKKIIFTILVLSVSLFAELTNQYITKDFLQSGIPIVDIRTAPEWRETGILPNAIPLTFFDRYGNYNTKDFLKKLNEKVDTTKPFALICHTGNRTSMVSSWLSQELGYKVINLKGGMDYATKTLHLKTVPYKSH